MPAMNTIAIATLCALSALFLLWLFVALFSYRWYRAVWMVRTHEVTNPVKIRYEDIQDHASRLPFSFLLPSRKKGKASPVEGYLYSPTHREKHRELIVLSPGYGRTHLSYLIDIGLLTSWGYQVLAYDQYGTGLSSGNAQKGLHQGVYVLDSLLNHLAKADWSKDRPLILYGHSWGGYCALSVLKRHAYVKKVVARSPAGNPIRTTYEAGASKVGRPMATALYYAVLPLLFLRFGPKAFRSSQRAVRKVGGVPVLVTSCQRDPTLPPKASPIPYLKTHSQDNISLRIRSDASIHNDLLTQDGWDYYIKKEKEYVALLRKTNPDHFDELQRFENAIDRSKIAVDLQTAEAIKDFLTA